MKKTETILTLALIVLAIYWSFHSQMPVYSPDRSSGASSFSTDRAMEHVKAISQEPHAVGFPGHLKVRSYIQKQLEELGLETSIQEGYTAGDWGNLSKATNILARIKGRNSGKALVLLSHYDSNPHSSFGASDAGSGVATILEGVRAYIKSGTTPVNDIIILISDAEELGLNGADLFVHEHPWVKEVGLVLNFEARGSGGPGIMLLETNRGNSNLIEEFIKANPEYPVANSLAYSIYKMLPNDTDLTVFREGADIEGFNFAFIDDHFDYHTALDTYERLDKNTLTHQGSYLIPLLKHFGNTDLNTIKSLRDNVYFNMPFFNMVTYPFTYIVPMFILALAVFVLLLIHGFKKRVLNGKDILKGVIPVFFSIVINGLVGFYCWSLLKSLYPGYQDILQGFPYNGHAYILAFVLFSIGITFYAYHKFRVVKTSNLLVFPLFLWLVICGLISFYLKGAAFFIIPVFCSLVSFYISINQKNPSFLLLVFLGLPVLFIFSPIIALLPIGLGLKMLVAATLLTTLVFLLLLPLINRFRNKGALALLSFLLFGGFMISAHMASGFTVERPKPSSLLYIMDVDKKIANWATYDNVPTNWSNQYLNQSGATNNTPEENIFSSKYNTKVTQTAAAPLKDIKAPKIEVHLDTIIGPMRKLNICITPQRDINRLDIFKNKVPVKKAIVNGIPLSDYYLKSRGEGKLLTHYVSNNDDTELYLEVASDQHLELSLYEASNDLLKNSLFSIPERPKNEIPMPFVLNDAILTTQKLKFD